MKTNPILLLFLSTLASLGQSSSDSNLRAIAESKIEKAMAPYRQWSDGKVTYVGKIVYAKYGIIEPVNVQGQSKTNVSMKLMLGFKVLDVTDDGARIEPLRDREEISTSDNDIFVKGLSVYSGREYGQTLMIRTTGDSFEYRTVTGGKRVIPEYEFGKEITKEEFLARIAENAKRAQAAATNANPIKKPVAPVTPRHVEYTVVSGDTLNLIANKFNVTSSAIKASNGLQGDALRVGQRLLIPFR